MQYLNKFGLWILLLALAAFPSVVQNPYYIHLLVVIGIYAVLIFGLDIVVGYTGEVSLGHAGLFGIGAYAAGALLTKFGLPIWVTIPAATAFTAACGALLAIPALRVTGPYLAMVTLAFGTIIQILINEMDFITNGPQGMTVSKPMIWGHQFGATDFYYVVLAIAALSLVVVTRLLSSHYGRAFLALRGSPIAADCMGVSVYRYKVIAFVISAAFAGLAGSLYAYSEEYIAPNAFTSELSILFLLALTLGGRRSRFGALIGATIIVVLPNLLSDIHLFRWLAVAIGVAVVAVTVMGRRSGKIKPKKMAAPLVAIAAIIVYAFATKDIQDYRLAIFGLLILGVVYYLPDGIAGYVKLFFKPARQGAEMALPVTRGGDAGLAQEKRRTAAGGSGKYVLEAKNIAMHFGGLKAINDVTIQVSPGTVHGLIGPNGSGKSTMMNVLTGVYLPTSGDVFFNGVRLNDLGPSEIAQRGVARTFQNVQLFGEMTALENVLVGLHHTFKSNLLDVVFQSSRYKEEERTARERAASLLSFVGLTLLIGEEARNLPYGKQRMLEIARALGLTPSLLLLDEPAAGLRPADLPELRAMIEKVRQNGITVILIEHHMDLVMAVCDQVSVLDFGQKIADGKAAEVRVNPRVIEAYLGAPAPVAVESQAQPVAA